MKIKNSLIYIYTLYEIYTSPKYIHIRTSPKYIHIRTRTEYMHIRNSLKYIKSEIYIYTY